MALVVLAEFPLAFILYFPATLTFAFLGLLLGAMLFCNLLTGGG